MSQYVTLKWLKEAHDRKRGQTERWNYDAQPEEVHEWVSAGECEVVEWANAPRGVKAIVIESAPKDRMIYRKPKTATARKPLTTKE